MPPEYAIDGIFSTKSDVYSFGVLVIEIVSGKKNRSFIHCDHSLNLLGHVSTYNKYLYAILKQLLLTIKFHSLLGMDKLQRRQASGTC